MPVGRVVLRWERACIVSLPFWARWLSSFLLQDAPAPLCLSPSDGYLVAWGSLAGGCPSGRAWATAGAECFPEASSSLSPQGPLGNFCWEPFLEEVTMCSPTNTLLKRGRNVHVLQHLIPVHADSRWDTVGCHPHHARGRPWNLRA